VRTAIPTGRRDEKGSDARRRQAPTLRDGHCVASDEGQVAFCPRAPTVRPDTMLPLMMSSPAEMGQR
jgi:hypothetical protein